MPEDKKKKIEVTERQELVSEIRKLGNKDLMSRLNTIDENTEEDLGSARRREAYTELAKGITQIAAGMYGLKKGLAIKPELKMPDWERRIDRILDRGRRKKTAETARFTAETGLMERAGMAGIAVKERKAAATTADVRSKAAATKQFDRAVELKFMDLLNDKKKSDAKSAANLASEIKDLKSLEIPGIGTALTKDSAKVIKTASERRKTLKVNIAKLKARIKEVGTGTMTSMFDYENSALEQYLNDIAVDYAKLKDPESVARESEVKLIRKQLFEPGFWQRESGVQELLKGFDELIETSYKNKLEVHLQPKGDDTAKKTLSDKQKRLKELKEKAGK